MSASSNRARGFLTDDRRALLKPLLAGQGRRIALGVAAGAAQALATASLIPLVRIIFDRGVLRNNLVLLIAVAAGVAVLRALLSLLTLKIKDVAVTLKTHAAFVLRGQILENLYRRPYISYVMSENQPISISMMYDADRVGNMFDSLISGIAPAAFLCVALGLALLILNPIMMLAALLFAPVIYLVNRRAAFAIRANFRRYHQAHGEVARSVRLALDTFSLTRARAAEREEMARQAAAAEALRGAEMNLVIDNGRYAQLQSLTVVLVGMVVFVLGGAAVARHLMSMGALLAFGAAAALISGQVEKLIASLPLLVEGLAAADRLIAQSRASPPPVYAGGRVIDWSGRVALAGVRFAYDAAPILRDVSLALAPGECVGLIGANGAGKSTVVNLLLGFYRPSSGRLLADGIAYDELDLARLRRAIGLVPQHPVFFSGSALDNITYGVAGVTAAQVEALAERMELAAMLRGLPGGLAAPLGESGLMLSGGQRQMIAILRALVARPRLMILDEPTNHLDQATIRGLIRRLRAHGDHPAILLISHHPDIVREVDVLYSLERGRLTRLEAAVPEPAP